MTGLHHWCQTTCKDDLVKWHDLQCQMWLTYLAYLAVWLCCYQLLAECLTLSWWRQFPYCDAFCKQTATPKAVDDCPKSCDLHTDQFFIYLWHENQIWYWSVHGLYGSFSHQLSQHQPSLGVVRMIMAWRWLTCRQPYVSDELHRSVKYGKKFWQKLLYVGSRQRIKGARLAKPLITVTY